MAEYWRALKYPLLAWLVIDTVFTVVGFLVPVYATIADQGISTVIEALPLGAIAGYKMIQFKGTMFNAIVVGVVTGFWCVFLAVTEVGLILTPFGTYNPWDMLSANYQLFTADMIGAIVGGGYALMGKRA